MNSLKAIVKAAVRGATVLLFGAGVASAQSTVSLSAGPSSLTLPDGSMVPMWGYTCSTTTASTNASCAQLNSTGGWSPVVITVPASSSATLTINLTNNLSFANSNTVPTSLVIVGQLGGGLGNVGQRTTTQSPDHSGAQASTTWPIAGNPSGITLPVQPDRVQSFATEVGAGATTALTWGTAANPLRPGTYLIESGTHPSIQGPMGLYGILVVTAAPTGTGASEAPGTAYPGVTYNSDVPLLFSEIDPIQNRAVDTAVNTAGFKETNVWSGLAGKCGDPNAGSGVTNTCYPPAVNYAPLYYMINGVAFDRTNPSKSLFASSVGTSASPISGNVLVRLVNAGLRMHVPAIVGSLTTPQGSSSAPPTVPGFSLIAEDGNLLPGVQRVQNEVFMAAGKTYDVMVNVPAPVKSLPIYDRQLSLSANAVARDAGMLAYIGINGSGTPALSGPTGATANPDNYAVVSGQTLTVSDPSKGLIANDVNVYGVQVMGTAPSGLTLNPDGTFSYTGAPTSFTYCANGTVTGSTCSSGVTALVTLAACTAASNCLEATTGITGPINTFTANTATHIQVATPGLLTGFTDAKGFPLKVVTSPAPTISNGGTLIADGQGGFLANVSGAGSYDISFHVQNSQGTSVPATAHVMFPAGSGLTVTVQGKDAIAGTLTAINDYRWIIEEDRTFYIDPNCTTNPPPSGCPRIETGQTAGTYIVPTFGTNFHTSYMPVVATGCTGTVSCEAGQKLNGHDAVCDVGNGICRTVADAMDAHQTLLDPKDVHLDPNKRYYISVLPGDAADPFEGGDVGHGMGGAPIGEGQSAVTVIAETTPYPPSKLSVFVFQDDFPLNGEQDAGGGIDVLATNEPGLGGFNITIMDDAGGTGDATGQVDYDMFNQPLSNGLAGTIDPASGNDACPIGKTRTGTNPDGSKDTTQTGIAGTVVTCPKFESDGHTLSPLAGQAVINNMMPGRYGVIATPGADRISKGEEWLQTNTLDGQKAHDSFLKIGEAGYFQEYGPAGYHVSIGFANPKIISSRLSGVCHGTDPNLSVSDCSASVKGLITTERMSRTPDERLYSSGSNDSFAFTQCYVSVGDTDGEDFAFTKCNADGTFELTGLPIGSWRITVFDQWNDMLVDGLSTPVVLASGKETDMGQIAINQWQANITTSSFFDANGNGVRDANEQGLALVPTNIRFRDGSFSNFNNTDLDGNAGFNEVFPLFSWYVVESDTTRYKNTGTHVVYDAGGPADGTPCGPGATPPTAKCGDSQIAANLANTYEANPLPANLHVPGALYCDTADCTGTKSAAGVYNSTGRIDPPWVTTEGWQGFSGQNNILEFGKTEFASGENGGIHGHVVYASTRPFDDPTLLLQLSWEPLIPNVTINLYQEGTDITSGAQTLTLVDSTKTSSFDDWAQGFRTDGVPNMNCPGQTTSDLFYFTLFNQPQWLDYYSSVHSGGTLHTIPDNAQYKCYDGMHNWNQLQPAPYDGMYQFPSIAGRNPQSGLPTGGTGSVSGTNCITCVANPTDGTPMLPAGKYVVEVVVPPGYELVKEEDKNILIGDNFIAPVTVEFPGLGGSIFILPDQATVATATNPTNAQNSTTDLGRTTYPSTESDTGSVEMFWPCVGAARTIPDYISLFPGSMEVAPFAGATRNLCDRKEVTLNDQASALAKFYLFTSTHAAAHFTGVITDDFTSEFDPFSPQFGEKFAPPNLPISLKDWTGTEIARVYTDQWGAYNGLTYSTWEVNPPNPTGYSPTMMVTCMNDPGTGTTPDPLFNPGYSQFCYEIPFMPGQTQYMDTPVTPTTAYSEGYNHPDCAYPDATPAISTVNGDGDGPFIAGNASHKTLTINALGDHVELNNGYSGPQATNGPFNQKTVTRHYGFGGSQGQVTIGGISIPTGDITSWSDSQIVLNLSTSTINSIPACAMQQQAQYGGSTARCGQLAVTATNGKQSVDAVTVTIGGKAPIRVPADYKTIQGGIDAAHPGDLILVSPGVYNEILLMWKPVRLQGSGAVATVVNANAQPEGKMDPWRQRVNCLFGLALNGQPYSTPGHLVPLPGGGGNEPLNAYDPTGSISCPADGWADFNGGPNNPQVDRIPLEGILGWDTSLNGNLAELLQEPSLMGAYEGAGITVLAKGVRYPAGLEVFGAGHDNTTGANVAHEGQMPAIVNADGTIHGTIMLTNSDADCNTLSGRASTHTGYASNFMCNPSRIDGLSITDSSQGGGGIYVHGWAHMLEISNNRIYNNSGTLTGGITVGQGESPDALLAGNDGDPVGLDQQPWTCNLLVPGAEIPNAGGSATNQNANPGGFVTNQEIPFCYNAKVSIHNNSISLNSSIGDELFSSTPAGAGGVTFAVGSDDYQFKYNWVCGNLSTGDGGGLAHLGFSINGDIEHNSFLFNQSTNPTIATNGGGLVVMGTAPDGQTASGAECGSVTDVDCAPGLSDGTGPGLIINANLIMGNTAESGSGGGIRLQDVNGTEVGLLPMRPNLWNSVKIFNNIISNNVAGWDGAGISLQDSLVTDIVNNTVASNDTTASSGVLFNTLGAPEASAPGDNCIQSGSSTASCPQPAGLVTMRNTTLLTSSLPSNVVCPLGHGTVGGLCKQFSVPVLYNDVFWQNRAFYIGVANPAAGNDLTNQQNQVALFNAFTGTAAVSQPTADVTTPNGGGQIVTGGTGACVNPASFWEIGVRGDTGPSDHTSGLTLTPTYSVLSDATDYPSNNNSASDPTVVSQYCNGSRTPPEYKSLGYQVPPGISDATVPNPVFNLTPAATVDEGNNWINISWGPLALTNPVSNTVLGNYALASGSPAIDYIPLAAVATENLVTSVPTTDFFGNPRPASPGTRVDVGAVEFKNTVPAPTLSSISPNSGYRGHVVAVTLTGTNLTGASAINVSGTGITVSGLTVVNSTTITATFTIANGATTSARAVTVVTPGGTSGSVTFTVNAATLTSISPNTGVRGTTVPVTLTGNGLLGSTAVNVSGGGFTVSNFTVVNDTTVTARFAIATNAGPGGRSVTVAAPGGNTNAVTFTPVAAAVPALTSIAPNSGIRGAAVGVTLTGTNLTGATAISVSGGGITVSNLTVVSSTSVTATFTITTGATLSARNVSITTPGGTSNNVTFTVQGPTLTSISPTSGSRGTSVPVVLTGTNLAGASSITVSGSGVTASSFTVVNSTTINATLAITNGAGTGNRNVAVVTPAGTTGNVTFAVHSGTAAISAPTPAMNGGGTTTKTATITVSNTATGGTAGPIKLTAAPTITPTSGTGNGIFSITGGTCVSGFVINAGSSCTITVRYAGETNTATRNATVTITDTGASTASQTSSAFAAN